MNNIELIYNGLKRVNPYDIVAYDTNETSPFFRFVLVASVDSQRQAGVAIEYIKEELAKEGLNIKSCEGLCSEWVLIDGYDYLIHIMTPQERERIDIDKLFINANKLDLSEIVK